jgi:hypothetical protein
MHAAHSGSLAIARGAQLTSHDDRGLERDCDSPRCEALYERSPWAVCPECDGREGDGVSGEQCMWCTFGVVEVALLRSEGAAEPW